MEWFIVALYRALGHFLLLYVGLTLFAIIVWAIGELSEEIRIDRFLRSTYFRMRSLYRKTLTGE